jgi:hypothetical protein
VAVAEHHPRERLDLDVAQGLALDQREPPYLLLHERDVVDDLARQRRHQPVDLVGVEPEPLGRPAVEPGGVLADGVVAALTDVRDDVADPLGDLGVGAPATGADRGLQFPGHQAPLDHDAM